MKSVKLRLRLGSRRSAESETKVCAPVRERDTRGFASAVTVTPPTSTAARFTETFSSSRWPRASWNGALRAASKPSDRVSSV